MYGMQGTIKQQEQQLANIKKDRDQLCFIVDERSNELRNLKQKNEQLEQMIRNSKKYLDHYEDILLHYEINYFQKHMSTMIRILVIFIFMLDQEHSNDEKKLFSLLQESQEERDELLSQQVLFVI